MHTWDTVRGMSEDIAEKAMMPYAMTILPPCLSASVPPRSWVPSLSTLILNTQHIIPSYYGKPQRGRHVSGACVAFLRAETLNRI